ncbi:MAG: GNAT family N-acetyltransferase [Methanobacteriota archaeon]
MDTRDLFRALLGFWHDAIEAAVDVVRTPWGVITRADRYPTVHMANEAFVASPPEGGMARILADMDATYDGSDIRHRRVWFEDADAAFAAQEAFAAAGFRPLAELAMARLGQPSCIVNPDVEVRRVDARAAEEDHLAVWLAIDEAGGFGPDLSRQLHTLGRDRAALLGQQRLVAYLDGSPAGIFLLWPRGRFALIDDVGTHPRFRMKGVGRTMISEACHRATLERCEYTLLTADLFDTPRLMYKTLGFEPIGEVRGFLRG